MTNAEVKLLDDLFRGAKVHFWNDIYNREETFYAGSSSCMGLGQFYKYWHIDSTGTVKILKIETTSEIKNKIYEYLASL